MTSVGGDGLDRLFARVESKGIAADVLAPERRLEPLLELRRFAPQLDGSLMLAEHLKDLGHPEPGVEHVALEFAQCLGLLDLTTVGIHDRIVGIFPADVLVAEAAPRLVFLEAVMVQVARLVNPAQATQGHVAILAQQCLVPEPLPCLVEDNQIQDGRVGRAVVRRVRDPVQVRQLSATELVQDLAGLRVTPIIPLGGLQLRQ